MILKPKKNSSRRAFIKTSIGAAGLALVPGFLPSRLFGAEAPGKKIQVAQIGCGRMGFTDMMGVLCEPLARVVAVCDLDAKRLAHARETVEDFYSQRGEKSVSVKTWHDFRDVLASPEIDAVVISVPDHWHALVAIQAALAGKHVYVEKPVTYSIAEAIGLRQAVEARKIILQTGSQQRSERPWRSFRIASEAVRNGRIGRLKSIKIGMGMDKPRKQAPAPMPVPENLDYERWLGPAPEQPYMEDRVHPQNQFNGRPGWITTEDFGLGMITNWGAHHLDIAQWALGQELGGPHTIEAKAQFMEHDVWTVHTKYHVELRYPGDVPVILDNQFTTGIQFEGEEGWVFCTRGEDQEDSRRPLRVSDKKILSPLPDSAIRWMPSKSHYGNWLESIVANRPPIAPIQQSARSLSTCAAAWIGMKLGRKLTWDVATERFVGDDAANALRIRPARKPEYDFELILKKAGIV